MWADEVEIAHLVLPRFLPDLVEEHTALFELVDDDLLAVLSVPHNEEMVESVVFAPDVLAGVVLQAFGHQIARDRIVLDPLGNNLDGNAVNVVLDMAALVIGRHPANRPYQAWG